MARPRSLSFFALLVWLAPAVASAQPEPPPPPEPPPDAEPVERARRLFLEGNELREAGDCEKALERYAASRKLVPRASTTINSAICLEQLGRADEALEAYESAIAEFRDQITEEDRAAIVPETARLRLLVGSIDVHASVEARLVVDGRERGSLPRVAPVRAMPGRHVVRVIKPGYETFEQSVEVVVGATATVDAPLRPLTQAGQMVVDDPALAGADVYVDGALVGRVPWEGTLAAGEHSFSIEKGDAGSGPRRIVIVEGQSALGRTELAPLAPPLRIEVEPPTAELRIDAVRVVGGRWLGRLPVGRHVITATEEGYVPREEVHLATPEGHADLRLVLGVDRDHPRWGTEPGHVLLEAFGGPAFAPTLGSGAEASCSEAASCSANGVALGGLVGGRVGYEFPFGLAVEIAGGYLRATKELARAVPAPLAAGVTATYDLVDYLRLSGPFVAAGIGFRLPFADDLLELRVRGYLGVAYLHSIHLLSSGTATAGGAVVPVEATPPIESVGAADVLVMPEIALGVRYEGFGLALGLDVALLTLQGPRSGLAAVEVVTDPACYASPPPADAIRCAPQAPFIGDERNYGLHAVIVPSLGAGYLF